MCSASRRGTRPGRLGLDWPGCSLVVYYHWLGSAAPWSDAGRWRGTAIGGPWTNPQIEDCLGVEEVWKMEAANCYGGVTRTGCIGAWARALQGDIERCKHSPPSRRHGLSPPPAPHGIASPLTGSSLQALQTASSSGPSVRMHSFQRTVECSVQRRLIAPLRLPRPGSAAANCCGPHRCASCAMSRAAATAGRQLLRVDFIQLTHIQHSQPSPRSSARVATARDLQRSSYARSGTETINT